MLPPDVNTSQIDFAVVEGKIRFGLNAVKNVGESACRAIVRAREEGGPFTSIWDFTERVDPHIVNKRALESLVKCGALDSTGAPRRGMLECLEQALAWGQKQQADKLLGQGSIFDLGEPSAATPRRGTIRRSPPGEFEKSDLLKLEKETLGLYVSEHPLTPISDQLRRKTDCTLNELERRRDGEIVTSAASSPSLKQMTTKKGDPMVFAGLEDVTGSCEVVAFNSVYAQRARAARAGPRADRARAASTTSSGGDEARRDRGHAVRGDAGAARGAAEGRRAHRAGRRRAGSGVARRGLPRRGAGVRRAGHVAGPKLLELGPGRSSRCRTSSPRPSTCSARPPFSS